MAQDQLQIMDDDEGLENEMENSARQLDFLRHNGIQGTRDIRPVIDILWQQKALNDNLAELEESWTDDNLQAY